MKQLGDEPVWTIAYQGASSFHAVANLGRRVRQSNISMIEMLRTFHAIPLKNAIA